MVCGCNQQYGKKSIYCNDCLITQETTAVKVAEAIAMETYGEDKIKSERPYKVSVVSDSLWKVEGTCNRIGFGGVFSVTLSANNGRVVEICHGK